MGFGSTVRLSSAALTGNPADVEILVPSVQKSSVDLSEIATYFRELITDDSEIAAEASASYPTLDVALEAAAPVVPVLPWILLVSPLKAKFSALHNLAQHLTHVTNVDPRDAKAKARLGQARLKAEQAKRPLLVVAEIEPSGSILKALEFARLIEAPICGIVGGLLDPSLRIRPEKGRPRELREIIEELDCTIVPSVASLAMLRPRLAAISGMHLPAPREPMPPVERDVAIIIDQAQFNWRTNATAEVEKWRAEATRACKDAKVKFAIFGRGVDQAHAQATKLSQPHDERLQEEIAKSAIVITGSSDVALWAVALGKRVIYFNPTGVPVLPFEAPIGASLEAVFRWQDLRNRIKQGGEVDPGQARFLGYHSGPAGDVAATIGEILNGLGNIVAVKQAVGPTRGVAVDRPNVVVWAKMPRDRYSGGRYHAWMMAEGLAAAGMNVTVATDAVPLCARDFVRYRDHHRIRYMSMNANDELSIAQPADIVVLAPGMERVSELYVQATLFARRTGARLVMLNYESPNWFNSMSPHPRDEALWENWYRFSGLSSVVLSTAYESLKFAQHYYREQFEGGFQDYLWAGINSEALDTAAGVERENRLAFFFPRIGHSEHKGWAHLPALLTEALQGAIVSIIGGAEPLPADVRTTLEERAAACGVTIEYHSQLDDRAKFALLRRSRVLLFTSTFEGYGYPPIEALAAGAKCVAFDLPVLRETCGDYLHYAPRGNWPALAARLGEAWLETEPLSPDATERALFVAGFDQYAERLAVLVGRVMETPVPWTNTSPSASIIDQVRSHFVSEIVTVQQEGTLIDLLRSLDASELTGDAAGIFAEALTAPRSASPHVVEDGVPQLPRLLLLLSGDHEHSANEADRLLWEIFRHGKDNGFAIDVVWLGNQSPVRITEALGDQVRCVRLANTPLAQEDTARLEQLTSIVDTLKGLDIVSAETLATLAEQGRRKLRSAARGKSRDDVAAAMAMGCRQYHYDAILVSGRASLDTIDKIARARNRPLILAAVGRDALAIAASDRRADYHIHYIDEPATRQSGREGNVAGLIGIAEDPWLLGRGRSVPLGSFDRRQIAIIADPVTASSEEAERFLLRNWQRLIEISGPQPLLVFGTKLENVGRLPIQIHHVATSIAGVQAQVPNAALAIDFTSLARSERTTGWIPQLIELAGVPSLEITATGRGQARAAMAWIAELLGDRERWIATSKQLVSEAEARCAASRPFDALEHVLKARARAQRERVVDPELIFEQEEAELAAAVTRRAELIAQFPVKPADLMVLWALAHEALEQGELEIGIEYLTRAYRAHPDNIAIMYRLARLHLREGNVDHARAILYRIAARMPLHANVQVELARLALDSGDAESACRAATAAILLDPLSTGAMVELAASLHALDARPEEQAWAAIGLDALFQPADRTALVGRRHILHELLQTHGAATGVSADG